MSGIQQVLSVLLLSMQASAQNYGQYANNYNANNANANANNGANMYNQQGYGGNDQANAYGNQNGQNDQYSANNNQNGANYNQDAGDYQDNADADGNEYVENEAENWQSNYQNYYAQNYDNEDAKEQGVVNCANPVVEVKSVSIVCDSPYTYYYGNGAHLNSQICDYGDKALVTVYFSVTSSALSYNGDSIYMTMGVYKAGSERELVWAARSVEVCENFVGHSCTQQGDYAFAFRISLDYGQFVDRNQFVPQVEMGFSTRQDEGYELGGVNINCDYGWNSPKYNPYSAEKSSANNWGAGTFSAMFGFIFGALMLATAVGLYFWKKKGNDIEYADTYFNQGNLEKEQELTTSEP